MTKKIPPTKHTKTDVPLLSANKKPKSFKIKLLSLLTYVVSFGLLYYLFAMLLPSKVDFAEIMLTIRGLTIGQNLLLLLAGSGTIWAIGWTAATVLPGISVPKATQASVVSQLTAIILPPPSDMVIRFGMYKSFGFAVHQSSIAVILSGIARYFTVVAVPLVGIVALILFGEATWAHILWLTVGSIIFAGALWIIKAIISSDKAALVIGKKLQLVVNWGRKLFKQKPLIDLTDNVVDIGKKSRRVTFGNFRPIAVSNLAWGFTCFLVLLIAVRFCGIDASTMSAAYLIFITGVMLLLNSLPLPGSGLGVTEAMLLSLMTFPNDDVQNAFAAALVLYRIYTWLWPLPVGAVAYFAWRHQTRTQTPSVH